MTTQQLKARDAELLMQTYGRYPLALVRGEGCRVWDADGKEYLDFLGGIAVNLLGHCHPRVVQAIAGQAARLIHCSNLYYTQPSLELARMLVDHGGLERVFFCNSGAEANEGAFKLARKYHYRRGDKDRIRILSMSHAFHGRTAAALAATPKPSIQEGFGPMPQGFFSIEFNDLDALDQAIDDTVAAVIIEPVQGESGIHPSRPEFLKKARELTRSRGALLIFDEVQCGLGRLGKELFAYSTYGVTPDIITLAKGLGGGLPLGAICASAEVATKGFSPGDHATTFGANPVACAGAVAVLQTIIDDNLLERVAEVGGLLKAKLEVLRSKYPAAITDIRGRGCMVGMEVAVDAAAVLEQCHERGLLTNVAGGNVIRLLPPYTVSNEEIDRALAIVEAAIASVVAPTHE